MADKRTFIIDWAGTCDHCCNDVLNVTTEFGGEEFLCDGDDVVCPECGLKGTVMVTDDYDDDCQIYVSWGEPAQ